MVISDKSAVKGYELLGPIGEGAYGIVYRARQPFIDRDVALKVILPEFASQHKVFRQLTLEERQRFGLPLLEE